MTQLQIIDDKKQITEKKSVISACNVDYRLKRSGPYIGTEKNSQIAIIKTHSSYTYPSSQITTVRKDMTLRHDLGWYNVVFFAHTYSSFFILKLMSTK